MTSFAAFSLVAVRCAQLWTEKRPDCRDYQVAVSPHLFRLQIEAGALAVVKIDWFSTIRDIDEMPLEHAERWAYQVVHAMERAIESIP